MIVRIPNWLGDALMATPVYENLRFQEDLILFGPPSFLKLFEDFPHVALMPYFKNDQKFNLENLKNSNKDKGLLLTNSFSSAWLFYRAGLKYIMGYATDLRAFLLTKKVKPPKEKMHQRDKYLYLIEKIGYSIHSKELVLPIKEEKIILAKKFLLEKGIELSKGPIVLLAPGAAYGPAKKWPTAYYKSLAEKLSQKGFTVIVVGGKEEKNLGEYIKGESSGIYNLCGETNITLLAGIFSLSHFLVSNDSGLMHLGATLKLPQIAIFGSTDPNLTGPLNTKAKVLKISIECSPCFKRTCPKGHYKCLKEISPDEVFRVLLSSF